VTWRYRVPGRVELVGKHTDYAGGPSVTCATPFHMHASVEPLREPVVRVYDQRSRSVAEVALAVDAMPAAARWSVYLAAVARRVARDFPLARTGVELKLGSTIPTSSGMSSSSALVVTVAMALFDANALWATPAWQAVAVDDLAFPQYCAAVESGAAWAAFAGDLGVGTRGGAQDHIAICASRDGEVGEYAYLPGRVVRRVAWPAEWRIVVANSGVKATKTGNAMHAYNRVADSVRTLVAAWNVETGRTDETLAAVLASADDAFDRVMVIAPRTATHGMDAAWLVGRLMQYRHETDVVVPRFVEAVERGDAALARESLEQSQRFAEERLENQVPQTAWLAAHASEHGAMGATAFGAGFGGAVWALVTSDGADEFAAAWMASYGAAHPELATRAGVAHVMRPSAGATRRTA